MKSRVVKKIQKGEPLKPRQKRIRVILLLQSAEATKKVTQSKKVKSQPKASTSSNGLSVRDMAFLLDMPLQQKFKEEVLDLTEETSDEETTKPAARITLKHNK